MKTNFSSLATALFLFGLALSISAFHSRSAFNEEDEAAIQRLHNDWVTGVNTGDARKVAATFAEDGIELPTGVICIGRDAIRERYQSVFEDYSADFKYVVEEIDIEQDLAFTRFTFSATWIQKKEDALFKETGKGINILRRQKDGSWKIIRNIWNRDQPMQREAP